MWPQLKHYSFSWKNCLLASIVLMTFACVYLVLSFTKDTGRVPFQLYTSTVSGCITYFVSFQPLLKVVYQGSITQFSQFFSVCTISGLTYTCSSLLRVDITNPKACWLCPLSAMHLNFCSRSHKIPESSSN